MNPALLMLFIVLLLLMCLVGRCDSRHAAEWALRLSEPSHVASNPLTPAGLLSAQKGGLDMAWRPIRYLIEGEIDNTVPGKITGWLQFAPIRSRVLLDLAGDFHRDIRGTRVILCGDGCREGAGYLYGFSIRQTGKAGDMTAGYPPHDCRYGPCFEWYSEQNGRVLLEPARSGLTIYGRPLPADQCEPISRESLERLHADFLREAARHARTAGAVTAMAAAVPSDPAFSHWVIVDDRIAGEAYNVQPEADGYSAAYIHRFDKPGHVHRERIETGRLRGKNVAKWIR